MHQVYCHAGIEKALPNVRVVILFCIIMACLEFLTGIANPICHKEVSAYFLTK